MPQPKIEQQQQKLDTESRAVVEKALVTKENVTFDRVHSAADKLTQRMTESNSSARNRFREKSPTFVEKAKGLFETMIKKVEDVKGRMTALAESVKARSQKGAETGTKTEQALIDMQKSFEAKSPEEQKQVLQKGIELVASLNTMIKSGDVSQKTEGGRSELERVLLEEKIPFTMRVPVSDSVTFRRAGGYKNEQQTFFSDKDLQAYKGRMNAEGGVIVFVDRGGKAWVAGDSPENRKALNDANYFTEESMNVPLSRGEDLSEHFHDESMENYQVKWKRIQDIARARREEGYARVQQQKNSEQQQAA
ncbi:MAG: hypothetical protein AAB400_05040 [Patescibacteria group bacterium]